MQSAFLSTLIGIALEFCEGKSKNGEIYASQNSSVTVRKQRNVLFSHCVQFPSFYLSAKITREHSKERSLAIFGGLEGN